MENKKYNILVSDNIAEEGIKILKEKPYFEVDVITKHNKDELKEIIGKYHAIIVRSATKLTKDVLDAAVNLKVIARAGTGYDNIDVEEATKRGIVVLITPLGNTNAVVELTIGLMINFARHITLAHNSMIEGKWEKKRFLGTELKGKTIGILGLGRIGMGVAKRCKAFEMDVIAYDKFVPKSKAEELNVRLVDDLKELLKESDFISIHLPLTEQTRDLISYEEFKIMKKNAVLINVARGGIANEDALYKALKEHRIGGACIDVYTKEPAKREEHPFIGLDNCITTPHLGANTTEAQKEVAKLAAEHIKEALLSNVFIDAVNIQFKIPEHLSDIYRPYMELGHALGKFISQYNKNTIKKVSIKYKGGFSYFEPIKAVILLGIFKHRLSDEITYMNLERVLKENDIKIDVRTYEKPVNFQTYIKVYTESEDGHVKKIAGSVFNERPKIVEIDGFYFDMSPTQYMILLNNYDRPGVLGRIGTYLGDKNINIAGLQLGRKENEKTALSLITIDEPISEEALNKLKTLRDVIDAYKIII
ncbi:MAG: phosphoglycerate dehydrogenase [Promethearchaeota archaeon]